MCTDTQRIDHHHVVASLTSPAGGLVDVRQADCSHNATFVNIKSYLAYFVHSADSNSLIIQGKGMYSSFCCVSDSAISSVIPSEVLRTMSGRKRNVCQYGQYAVIDCT